jgi:hypothetical protein
MHRALQAGYGDRVAGSHPHHCRNGGTGLARSGAGPYFPPKFSTKRLQALPIALRVLRHVWCARTGITLCTAADRGVMERGATPRSLAPHTPHRELAWMTAAPVSPAVGTQAIDWSA